MSRATDAADREVRRLHEAEGRLHEDQTAARAAIAAADERLAGAALAGGEPLDTAALTAAQARERAAAGATDAAREQRDAANPRPLQGPGCRQARRGRPPASPGRQAAGED